MRARPTLFTYLRCVSLLALLSACSTTSWQAPPQPQSTQDRQPSEPFDATHVPDAVVKAEPLSKYGNPPQYEVNGKRYYTSKTRTGHIERGLASWYGTKFHGKRTSSGEPYDMYAMTAAHKTLPLPTYAEVTNLGNNKKVTVRINDRGPFHGDRIIDLSYAAALKLGIVGTGTARVEVRALEPVANIAPTSNLDDAYALGAFGDKSIALEVRQ